MTWNGATAYQYSRPNSPRGMYLARCVIVTPPPRVEYRGLPPAASYIWIDGYWNWVGHRHDWVSGYWAPPGTRPRSIVQHRQFERHRDDDRRERFDMALRRWDQVPPSIDGGAKP